MPAPEAGSLDVYKFMANLDGDVHELYWAYDGEVVYVWGTVDGATLILEADDFGYGWIMATSSSTLCGCSAV